MSIIGEAIVSCYIDVASFLVMILLLLLSERIRKHGNASLRVLFHLCVCITVLCVLCFFCHATYKQPAAWYHTLALVSRTAGELLTFLIIILWIVFVNRKLYGEKRRHSLKNWLSFAPFAPLSILLIVNLFTGIVFTYSEINAFEPKPLFYLIVAVEFGYFAASAIIAWHFDRKSTKKRFLHFTPMLLSVAITMVIQCFVPYDTGIMGFAVGIALLYFSMVSENRFVDEESGLYNKGYLAYLFDLALAGKSDAQSALIIEAEGNLPACFEILRGALHQNGDVIRVENGKFLMFSNTGSRSKMQYISSLVEEAEEKYNAEHPDSRVQIAERCRMRTRDEDSFTFLRAVMDEKETGDEMRGIVSMMSELDKELKLAADIQINMLPMNFPPFPERTEFDLYASMRPAKEVGGDFYDFFLIDDDHLGLVIADVSGKGIPAALFMMVSKTLIKNQLMSGCDPAEALEHVNLQLCERNSSMMFVTVWLAVLEISTGRGVACNAGHENPCIRRAGGDFELLKYKHGMFIGVSKKAKYQNREFEIHPGDSVFVYTDGVPEATNPAMEMFGEERLTSTLNLAPDAEPDELIRRMHDAVDRFADGAPQFDDITMLCLKYHGSRGRQPAEIAQRSD